MPLELARLPIIESSYDPFAYSPAHAVGLWQFIPSTGRHFNLRQTSWYDGRRDITASTNAALRYLSYLHGLFNGDWLLALAAYNRQAPSAAPSSATRSWACPPITGTCRCRRKPATMCAAGCRN